MSRIFIAGALALAVATSGCAQAVSDINAVTAALTSPAANQAAANLKAGAMAVVCDVSSLAALDQQINNAIDAGQAIDKDVNDIYVVSTALCKALGGTPIGSAVVPANAQ